jgi:F-type H+-transporting ATPase subunit c
VQVRRQLVWQVRVQVLGIVFAALVIGISRNPSLLKQLFTYALLGFALTEAIALFGLMMSFSILFGK